MSFTQAIYYFILFQFQFLDFLQLNFIFKIYQAIFYQALCVINHLLVIQANKNMLAKLYKHFFSILANDKIVFFGSGTVAYPSAVKLKENYQNTHFITHYTPQKQKLSNQVQIFCKQNNLNLSTPIKSKTDKIKINQQWNAFAHQIKDADFGVVCSFGYMIPKTIISLFKKGMIVIHPSLLPKYRGGAPIFHAIANGQKQSGVSYIQISPGKFDAGNILLQKLYSLNPKAKYHQIQLQLSKFCANNLLEVLKHIETLRPGVPQQSLQLQQSQLYKAKAPIIKSKHLSLDLSAQRVYNLSRALGNPRIKFMEKQLILSFENKYFQDCDNKQIGTLKVQGKKLYVKCQDKYLKIQSWREPSKKQTPCGIFIAAYLRGKQQKDWPKFS